MKLPRYLFPSDYMADPSANVFNDRLFIYPSHDWDAGECFDDDGGHFQMRDYHVLSFGDVENDEATDHGVILSVDQVPWAEKQMWDNDVVEKDGRYYLIFSAKGYDGVFHLGVAVSDKPEGPFKPEPQPIRGSFSIDPCVFKDDDGEIYCYFGGLWGGQLQWWQHIPGGKAPVAGKYGDDNGLIDLGPAPDHATQLFAHPDDPALPSMVVRMSSDVKQFAEAPRPVVILGEDGKPQGSEAESSKDEYGHFDANGKPNVLTSDFQGSSGDTDGKGDLRGFVVHQHHISGFDGSIRTEASHRNAHISTGQDRGIIDTITDEGSLRGER